MTTPACFVEYGPGDLSPEPPDIPNPEPCPDCGRTDCPSLQHGELLCHGEEDDARWWLYYQELAWQDDRWDEEAEQ